MKILEKNAGSLTNSEVLEFLRSKGAAKDPTRVIAKVSTSEYKVYDYLVQTPAATQTRANIGEFLEKIKKYDLAKAEILSIINLRPSNPVGVYSIIESCDVRMGDDEIEELVEIVGEVFPPPESKLQEKNDEEEKVVNTEQVGEDTSRVESIELVA